MSRRDLTAEQAAKLPGPILYTPYEVAWMTKLEYEGVLAAIKDGHMPAKKFGRIYRVPAWWVNKQLTGQEEIGEGTS